MNLNKDNQEPRENDSSRQREENGINDSRDLANDKQIYNGNREPDSLGGSGSNAGSRFGLPPLAEISGLGGWLVLIQIGIISTLIMNIIQLFAYTIPAFQSDTWDQLTVPGAEYYHPIWKPALIFDLVSSIAIIVFVLFALVAFYRKKRYVPSMMYILYSGSFLLALTQYLILQNIPEVGELDSTVSDLVRGFITSTLWILYFVRSKRVHNTFVR